MVTISDVAGEVRSALEVGDEASAVRVSLDFARLFDGVDPDRRAALVSGTPGGCGDPRFDALLAAAVEHLCVRDGVAVPAWVEDPDRFLETWWFVSGLRRLHASALVQSPISFARRGVFICDGALSYA